MKPATSRFEPIAATTDEESCSVDPTKETATQSSRQQHSRQMPCILSGSVLVCSILLLVISSVEFFNLLIAVPGVGGSPSNPKKDEVCGDFFGDLFNTTKLNATMTKLNATITHECDVGYKIRSPALANMVDFVISFSGILVSCWGFRVRNKPSQRGARLYLAGILTVGIAWMAFNYWFTVYIDQDFDQWRYHKSEDDDFLPHKTKGEYYRQDFQIMIVPGMVWFFCYCQAWCFKEHVPEDSEFDWESAQIDSTVEMRNLAKF